MKMLMVLPYNVWRGKGLHFHGEPVGSLACYGFMHLLFPMFHGDESFLFERRSDRYIRKEFIHANKTSLPH
jgi:hypothetical protein